MKWSYPSIPKSTMFNLAFNKKKQKARQQQMMQLLREGASGIEQKQDDDHDDDTTSAASDSYRSSSETTSLACSVRSSSSSFISSAAASTSSSQKRGYARGDAPSPPGSPSMKGCLHMLPESWEPSPYSVIIGRGHVAKASTGNRRLDVLAMSFLPRYAEATSKAMKTGIVSELISTIRNACPVGAFIRYVNGRWWEVDESTAREKVGYCLRNLLHDKYSTSAKSKTAHRRRQRSIQQQEKGGLLNSQVASSIMMTEQQQQVDEDMMMPLPYASTSSSNIDTSATTTSTATVAAAIAMRSYDDTPYDKVRSTNHLDKKKLDPKESAFMDLGIVTSSVDVNQQPSPKRFEANTAANAASEASKIYSSKNDGGRIQDDDDDDEDMSHGSSIFE